MCTNNTFSITDEETSDDDSSIVGNPLMDDDLDLSSEYTLTEVLTSYNGKCPYCTGIVTNFGAIVGYRCEDCYTCFKQDE